MENSILLLLVGAFTLATIRPTYSATRLDAFTRRSRSLTSIFENSRTEAAYDYAEDLNDGRGVTFGFIGFTTKNGDGKKVVLKYKQKKPNDNAFEPFISALNNGGIGINSRLFIAAVKKAGSDQKFIDAQEEVWRAEYWTPSQNEATKTGVKLALSKAQLYDTWVQHGEEDEPGCCKGTKGIIRDTNARMGKPTSANEKEWMREFLRQRRKALTTAQGSTASVWSASTKRIDIYEGLVTAGAWSMDKPLSIGKTVTGAYSVSNSYYGVFYIS